MKDERRKTMLSELNIFAFIERNDSFNYFNAKECNHLTDTDIKEKLSLM